MTQRPWVHNAGRSAVVVLIAGAGMVATAEIRSLDHRAGNPPPSAAGPPLPGPVSSASASSPPASHGRETHGHPAVTLTPEPGSGAQLVAKEAGPTPDVQPRASAQRTSPATTPPSAPAPGPSPTTPSSAPAPTPTATRVATPACVINLLGIKVCLGGKAHG